MPWRAAVVKYLEDKQHKKSLKNDKESFVWLDKYWGDKKLSYLTRDEIHRVRDIKRDESSPSTANKLLEVIRTLVNMAEREWEWIEKAPAVKLFTVPKPNPRWLPESDARKLVAALPEYLSFIVRFALATGLREQNILRMEWKDVDLNRRVAWVHADMIKNGRALGIPLNDDAVDVIRKQIGKHQTRIFTYKGRPLGSANNRSWRNALKRVKIENFRFHDLRHTWASWLRQAGTPLNIIQELGGWQSEEMVLRYAHLDVQHLAEYNNAINVSFNNVTPFGQQING
jgi:integrase